MVLISNISCPKDGTEQYQFLFHKNTSLNGRRRKKNSLTEPNKNYFSSDKWPPKITNTALFLRNGWELKIQPMPNCNDKKIQKHSSCQENNFYKKINSYFPHLQNTKIKQWSTFNMFFYAIKFSNYMTNINFDRIITMTLSYCY